MAIKTDNGSNFTNRYTGYLKSTDTINPKLHAFDILCQKYNIIHYLIDPGKPSQNGKKEDFCLNGKTPNEMLELLSIN